MPELKGREKEERELETLLLLVFLSEDMDFWLSDYRSPQWFDAKLNELGLRDRMLNTSSRTTDAMLRDLRLEIERSAVDRRMGQLANFYNHEVAARLAHAHTQWLEQYNRQLIDNERMRRSGAPVEPLPAPEPEDIYPGHAARREAASSLTDWISLTEYMAAGVITAENDVKLVAYWTTESDPCPICEELRDQPQEVWEQQYPHGPKAHPNCRCFLTWRKVLD